MAGYVPRLAAGRLAELAAHLRVVMVSGPRQSGKTTLLHHFRSEHGGSYRTLDQRDTLRAARDDPAAFVAYGALPRMVDEVQLGGDDLIRAIKVEVDTDPNPGRFILSGSTRFLTIPTLSESLAGRLAFVELWPLSMPERTGAGVDFLRRVFADPTELITDSVWTRREYLRCVAGGGFPEVLPISSPVARRAWYDGYLSTVLNRDIRDFATITHTEAVGKLLRLIAARAGQIAVLTDLAHGVELARDTTRKYLSYLDMAYLTTRVPAWSTNLGARLTKTQKLYVTDSGLATHLMDVEPDQLDDPEHPAAGPLVETFVTGELRKAIACSDLRVELYHLRTTDRREIDFVLAGPGGKVVAVEVKATTSPGRNALNSLRWARERFGDRLHAGVLLHLGTESAARGDRLYTMPLSVLWDHRRPGQRPRM